MKKKLFIILLFGMFQLTNFEVNAQPGFDDDVEDTPIDGGVGILLASGLAFGAQKLRKNLKAQNESNLN